MKVAIYPGSFNPWHVGHEDVLWQALKAFDKVIIAQGINPLKDKPVKIENYIAPNDKIEIVQFTGLLKDCIAQYKNVNAIIKGLRNNQDFEYEKIQQYYNEDLGIKLPVFYVISDRRYTHISSSAIRMISTFQKDKK